MNYQVGDLISTIPLAPKEMKKYTTKKVVKKKRSEKEIENALQIKKESSSQTSRVHDEIVQKASRKTNFKTGAEGGIDTVVFDAKGSFSLETDSSRQSAHTKKSFREAVLKAAQEYKNERRTEIQFSDSEDFEETNSGEISNPNDELPVTYLFYELQRRYKIRQKFKKFTPVILVANEVPRPDEIDEDWLLAHDWILRRAILDDSFLPALDYLSEGFVGDEIALEALQRNMEAQFNMVSKLSEQALKNAEIVKTAEDELAKAVKKYNPNKDSGGFFTNLFRGLTFGASTMLEGGDGGGEKDPKGRMVVEAANAFLDRASGRLKNIRSDLNEEVTALEAAVNRFSETVKEQFNRRTEILRLRAHVKDNILYYMQAIWDLEPSDQRYFRIFDHPVDTIGGNAGMEVTMIPFESTNPFILDPMISTEHAARRINSKLEITEDDIITKQLFEVADLDNLLGYKGNYMIFQLKENNLITHYMSQDYKEVDENSAAGCDPDPYGGMGCEDVLELVKCYKKNNIDITDEMKVELTRYITERSNLPFKEVDEVVVPSDSLYIESLPGAHPILEDFKLVHRAVDVKQAQAEVRQRELENIRYAGRVLNKEWDDPEIQKKVVVKGADGPDIDLTP